MKWKGRSIPIVLILMFIISPHILLEGEAVCPNGGYSVTVALAQAKQTAYVAPDQDGVVVFTGTVFLDIPFKPNSEGVLVHLHVSVNDWYCTNPEEMFFPKAIRQQSFTIKVYIPIGTPSATQGQLSVSGRWKYSNSTAGGTIPPATAIIFVKKYFEVEMKAQERFLKVNPGDSVSTRLFLKNRGNGEIHARTDITNRKEMEDLGIRTFLDNDKFTLNMSERKSTGLRISVPHDIDPGLYQINISNIESGPYLPEEYKEEIFVEVKERHLLGISYGSLVLVGSPLMILMAILAAFMILVRRKRRTRNNMKVIT